MLAIRYVVDKISQNLMFDVVKHANSQQNPEIKQIKFLKINKTYPLVKFY